MSFELFRVEIRRRCFYELMQLIFERRSIHRVQVQLVVYLTRIEEFSKRSHLTFVVTCMICSRIITLSSRANIFSEHFIAAWNSLPAKSTHFSSLLQFEKFITQMILSPICIARRSIISTLSDSYLFIVPNIFTFLQYLISQCAQEYLLAPLGHCV